MAKAKTANCQRCGALCKAESGSTTARPFRKSTRGLCTACVVCAFFQDDNPNHGLGFALPPDFDPNALRLPHVQAQFARVLAVGNSELTMAEINWDAVIDKWHLPLRQSTTQPPRRARSATVGAGLTSRNDGGHHA